MTLPTELSPDEIADDLLDPDYPMGLVDAQLREAGFNPDAIARRFLELAELRAKLLVFPDWVKGWRVILEAASASDATPRRLRIKVPPGDTTLPLTLRLEKRLPGAAPGTVIVHWESDAFHRPGWDLAVYTRDDAPPVATFSLGNKSVGAFVLTQQQLGFDPVRVPIGVEISARG